GASVVGVTNPQELKAWLVGLHRGDHLAGLGEALVNQTLSLVCAALDGQQARNLSEALEAWSGLELEGSLPARLEEAEEELGRQALEVGVGEWLAQSPPRPWQGLLDRLPGERVISLFPGQPELILTESDWDDRSAELTRLNREQQQRFSAEPLLLLASPEFEEPLRVFYRQLRLRCPATPGQLTVLALEKVSPAVSAWWERRQVKVFEQDLAGLERRLLEAAPKSRAQAPRRAARSPQRPYKFLDYFDPEDRSIFFGREAETEQLSSLLLTRPVCLLHGRSGVGKTSLLQAGVLARLPRPQNLVLVVRCLTEPVSLILAELEPLVGQRSQLLEAFQAATQVISGHLVVVCDQFEEFFVRLDRQARQPFFEQMATLVGRLPGRCHLVFSMREDFLAEMADFEPYFPTILDHRFRLRSLAQEQARRAIVGPAELFGLELDPALVERLLRELFHQGVEPPELQIVLDRLYETRVDNRLSLENYERLGGVRSILVDYLHTTLSNLAAQGVELPFVRRLLEQMVTERGTKAVVRIQELVERLGQPLQLVQQTLLSLVSSRLVRALADDQGGQYELAHEYIISEVIGWASQDELAVRHARQVLRAELESWQTMGSLLTAERLSLIARQRSKLDFSPEERAMVVRAAAIHGFALSDWTDPRDQEVLAALLEQETTPGPVARAVLARLYQLDPGERLGQVMAEACRWAGNPNLLAELDPDRQTGLFEALQEATRQRFFGPERMVRVTAGEFLMGSTVANKEARKLALRPDQRPAIESEPELAQIWLAEFYLDRHPVTNAEFAEFRPEHVHRFRPEHTDHPAVFVSWYDAVAYAEWLGKRLPSEAEWEKAARGCDGRLFPWGDRFESHRLNSAEGGRQATSAVGSFPNGVSPFGCQDMVGNVWEWTASAWREGAP
ncbi:MAG: SUMF1/EgtB/PvdO family nonheme iron enzyme, partial [Candidatus Eremiobacteraeota bacterium]|nr:SUMF1/EgtB/PvdO family nonheme iron enzyme [Candidatus Eremiobacteraeota bacterium]